MSMMPKTNSNGWRPLLLLLLLATLVLLYSFPELTDCGPLGAMKNTLFERAAQWLGSPESSARSQTVRMAVAVGPAAGGRGVAPTTRPYIDRPPRTTTPMGQFTPYFQRKSISVHSGVVDLNLSYYWFEPAKPWGSDESFPLVIVLHGAPGNGYAAEYLVEEDNQNKHPAFVFVPVLPAGMTWYQPNSTPAGSAADQRWPKGLPGAMEAVHRLVEKYPIDRRRIYVVGCSDGGFGVFGAVKEYGGQLAGAVAISGGWDARQARLLNKTPMLVMHGRDDSVIGVHWSRDVSLKAAALGLPIRYIEYPGLDHNCPLPDFYADSTWRWLFSQQKKRTPRF